MFKILNAHLNKDYKHWLNLWLEWKEKEIFAHPDFLLLFQEKAEACCALYEYEDVKVIFPFCKRLVGNTKPNAYDIITPYGYGDIYIIGAGNKENCLATFNKNFQEWAQNNNIVCEFIRFSLFSKTRANYKGIASHNNSNVVCDLTKSEDLVWREFSSRVRRNIKKAWRSQLHIEQDDSGTNVKSFLELYYHTMERLGAHSKYYIRRTMLEQMHSTLWGNFRYFYAIQDNVKVAAALVLISESNIYFFLGGSYKEFLPIRPNDLLHYEIIKWGIRNQKKAYILGGGFQIDDSLFKFKSGFAPKNTIPFYVGKNVYMKSYYDLLCKNANQNCAWIQQRQLRFPAYRDDTDDFLI